MIKIARLLPLSAALLGALLLSSCGGGGDSKAMSAPTQPSPPPGCSVRIVADSTVDAGKTASASALACSGTSLAEITWTQLSGPPVTLLAARSPTVAFETSAAGTVRLKADIRLSDGTTSSSNADIVVGAATSGSFITLRADHSVRMGTDTSIRAWPTLAGDDTVSTIAWTQVAGPSVVMNTEDNRLLMFTAPRVDVDTVLKFRAAMSTSSGRQDQDEVTVTVEPQAMPSPGAIFDVVARVHPYRQASKYAGVLERCAYNINLYFTDSTLNTFCPASSLPLIENEAGPGATPSVAQIMGRVLVSHDFLGANFEQFLQTKDTLGDFRRMLAGVSAIVIGSHVRPSFYAAATGAIYLDANNLWLTPEQRDVVTEVPDYRLAFDDELNYSSFGRLVRNNAYARRSFPATARSDRNMDDLVLDLGRLLYHELSHAGDFFSPANRDLDQSVSIWLNVATRYGKHTLPSDALATVYPLTSSEMKGLGQVLFQGATPSDQQKAYTGTDVGRFFGADRANDDYAYSINGGGNSREDLAMLFEEFMMSYRHGVQYDIAFANKFETGMSSGQSIVAWGERGRIAEPAIKPRIKLVIQRVAPWIDPAVVDSLPAPIRMTPGLSWDANLAISPANALSHQSARQVVSDAERDARLRTDLRSTRPQPPLVPRAAH